MSLWTPFAGENPNQFFNDNKGAGKENVECVAAWLNRAADLADVALALPIPDAYTEQELDNLWNVVSQKLQTTLDLGGLRVTVEPRSRSSSLGGAPLAEGSFRLFGEAVDGVRRLCVLHGMPLPAGHVAVPVNPGKNGRDDATLAEEEKAIADGTLKREDADKAAGGSSDPRTWTCRGQKNWAPFAKALARSQPHLMDRAYLQSHAVTLANAGTVTVGSVVELENGATAEEHPMVDFKRNDLVEHVSKYTAAFANTMTDDAPGSGGAGLVLFGVNDASRCVIGVREECWADEPALAAALEHIYPRMPQGMITASWEDVHVPFPDGYHALNVDLGNNKDRALALLGGHAAFLKDGSLAVDARIAAAMFAGTDTVPGVWSLPADARQSLVDKIKTKVDEHIAGGHAARTDPSPLLERRLFKLAVQRDAETAGGYMHNSADAFWKMRPTGVAGGAGGGFAKQRMKPQDVWLRVRQPDGQLDHGSEAALEVARGDGGSDAFTAVLVRAPSFGTEDNVRAALHQWGVQLPEVLEASVTMGRGAGGRSSSDKMLRVAPPHQWRVVVVAAGEDSHVDELQTAMMRVLLKVYDKIENTVCLLLFGGPTRPTPPQLPLGGMVSLLEHFGVHVGVIGSVPAPTARADAGPGVFVAAAGGGGVPPWHDFFEDPRGHDVSRERLESLAAQWHRERLDCPWDLVRHEEYVPRLQPATSLRKRVDRATKGPAAVPGLHTIHVRQPMGGLGASTALRCAAHGVASSGVACVWFNEAAREGRADAVAAATREMLAAMRAGGHNTVVVVADAAEQVPGTTERAGQAHAQLPSLVTLEAEAKKAKVRVVLVQLRRSSKLPATSKQVFVMPVFMSSADSASLGSALRSANVLENANDEGKRKLAIQETMDAARKGSVTDRHVFLFLLASRMLKYVPARKLVASVAEVLAKHKDATEAAVAFSMVSAFRPGSEYRFWREDELLDDKFCPDEETRGAIECLFFVSPPGGGKKKRAVHPYFARLFLQTFDVKLFVADVGESHPCALGAASLEGLARLWERAAAFLQGELKGADVAPTLRSVMLSEEHDLLALPKTFVYGTSTGDEFVGLVKRLALCSLLGDGHSQVFASKMMRRRARRTKSSELNRLSVQYARAAWEVLQPTKYERLAKNCLATALVTASKFGAWDTKQSATVAMRGRRENEAARESKECKVARHASQLFVELCREGDEMWRAQTHAQAQFHFYLRHLFSGQPAEWRKELAENWEVPYGSPPPPRAGGSTSWIEKGNANLRRHLVLWAWS